MERGEGRTVNDDDLTIKKWLRLMMHQKGLFMVT